MIEFLLEPTQTGCAHLPADTPEIMQNNDLMDPGTSPKRDTAHFPASTPKIMHHNDLMEDAGHTKIMCKFNDPSGGWGTPDLSKSCANLVILLGGSPNHVQIQSSFLGMWATEHSQIMCKFSNPSGGWGTPDTPCKFSNPSGGWGIPGAPKSCANSKILLGGWGHVQIR